MTEPLELNCPYCGEPVEIDIDEGGASRQSYVEDCSVCCRPWNVKIIRNRDGSWSATLQTDDD